MESKQCFEYIQILDEICNYHDRQAELNRDKQADINSFNRANRLKKVLIEKIETMIYPEIEEALQEKKEEKVLLTENKEIKKKKDAKKDKKNNK